MSERDTGDPRGCITDVPGIEVGHWTDRDGGTGCTVVLARGGARAAISLLGPYPATRDVAFLDSDATAVEVHGGLLTGGSAFGLDATTGVVRYLEERGIGSQLGPFTAPRVPTVAIFDLGFGSSAARPTAADGYRACEAAGTPPAVGSVGVGTGATVGKLLGARRAMKGGFGTAAVDLGHGVRVGAAVVTNSIGGVHDPASGAVLAGPRRDGTAVDSVSAILEPGYTAPRWMSGANTTHAVVATNATCAREDIVRLARRGHDALARGVRPLHTDFDGDAVLCLATGGGGAVDPLRLDAAAGRAIERALVCSVTEAAGMHGIPGLADADD